MRFGLTFLAAAAMVLTLFTAASPLQARDQVEKRILHFATERGAEMVDSIWLARGRKYNEPFRFYTLYSLKLPGLRAGDVVHATSQFEATNDLGFNVMLAHSVLLTREETIFSGQDAGPRKDFMPPCFPAGENVSRNMHHGLRNLNCFAEVPANGDYWVSVVIYGASSAAVHHSDPAKAKDRLDIERRYGGLSAIVHRN